MSYAYEPMRFKSYVCNVGVSRTTDSDYQEWKYKLDGYGSSDWRKLCERYGEEAQFGLLRAMAVGGIATRDWNAVFQDAYYEKPPFHVVIPEYLLGEHQFSWTYLIWKLLNERSQPLHYPPLRLEWLLPYGYTQEEYVQDLDRVWDDIHTDYFKLWTPTPLGQDSPEAIRLKKIGEAARREIDQVARHGSQYLKG